MNQRLFTSLLLFIGLLLGKVAFPADVIAAAASSGLSIEVFPQVSYIFGEQVSFDVEVKSEAQIDEAYLVYQPEGSESRVIPMQIDQNRLAVDLDLNQTRIPPFSRVAYWFQLKPQGADLITSASYAFNYDDNRFEWQTLENEQLAVFWHDGDLAFGQSALNTGINGLETASGLLGTAAPSQQIRIYIYPSTQELQSALEISGQPWLAGHASPQLGIVLVSIAPNADQRLRMEQQIPHELVHVMLYQSVGKDYDRIPPWLNEGLATLAELYPNADYANVLVTAGKNNTLLPMSSLCSPFPMDASRAFLSYAQSASFTRFLQQKYGVSGIQNLLLKYSDGLGCSEASFAAFGKPLASLESDWKEETLGISSSLDALRRIAPYLLLFAVLLLPVLIIGIGRLFSSKKG
ncbi:MAG TPA: peptidase MA family metallohydrolase [Anaerolineaceae bacterium]|nr:peptidase MA family metallohydrolase [Anaerolineaceae bacterium]HPN51119.1 peptidase MA family metallohydrolase [Anaerolineaceae bacterium]